MTLRKKFANLWLNIAISFGETIGLERTVELSDHSIEITLEHVDKDKRAWDTNLYKRGNVFLAGYSNPIKPTVEYNSELETPDTVEVKEGNQDEEQNEENDDHDDGPHVELISSSRYRDYMRQDLISQLLTPQEQWKLLAYAVGVLAILMLINVVVSMSAAGAF